MATPVPCVIVLTTGWRDVPVRTWGPFASKKEAAVAKRKLMAHENWKPFRDKYWAKLTVHELDNDLSI